MGGSETDPGMFINWSLRVGTTATRCITFNKFWPISRDLVFDIRILELWVVKEVIMKRKNVPNRDFLSTVIMWNKLGKTKSKEEEQKKADCRDSWFPDEPYTERNDNHIEILQTEEHHFEPSNPSLNGTKNTDEELLMAIKNRFAGGPQFPGSLSFKPETGLERIEEESTLTSPKPQYLSPKLNKAMKAPTQVSMAQVDDGITAEHKNWNESTGRFAQPEAGMVSMGEETAQSSKMQGADEVYQLPKEQAPQMKHTLNRTLQSDEWYKQPTQPRRNSFPYQMKQSSQSRAAISSSANSQPDGVIGGTVPRDRNSQSLPRVPDYYEASPQRPSVLSSTRGSNDEASYNQQIQDIYWTNRRNMDANLPYQQQLVQATPYVYDDQNARPTDARNKSGTSLREGSKGGFSMRDGSKGGASLRDVSREGIRERSPTFGRDGLRENSPQRSHTLLADSPIIQEGSKSSLKDRSREVQEHSRNSLRDRSREIIPGPPQTVGTPNQEQVPLTGTRDAIPSSRSGQDGHSPISAPPANPSLRLPPTEGYYIPLVPISCRENVSRIEHAPWTNERETSPSKSPSMSPSPTIEEQTVVAMTRVGSAQMCQCGSRELNLVCCCRKEVAVCKEEEVIKSGDCRCQRNRVCDDEPMHQRKPSRRKTEKEERRRLKAEQKRREAEARRRKKSEEKRRKREKEREKRERERERKAQKAREKEGRKQGKRKEKKIRQNPKECRMCVCCKCQGEENTIVLVPSETTECLKDSRKCKKNQKKEKRVKEKKKKRTKECNTSTPSFRPCQCPPTDTPVLVERSQEILRDQPAIQGYCNHPDVPCPGLENRGLLEDTCVPRGSSGSCGPGLRRGSNCDDSPSPRSSPKRIQRSGTTCGDPVCPYGKRNQRIQPCNDYDYEAAPAAFRECCCSRMGGGCTANICYTALVEHPPNISDLAAMNIRGNPPSKLKASKPNPPINTIGIEDSDAIRYRDMTGAPTIVFPNEMGHGDTPETHPHSGRSPNDPRQTSLPSGFSTNHNFLIDLSKRGRENCTNKRYVPPCVLYLDCTKVKDLCVIIKDKYDDPS